MTDDDVLRIAYLEHRTSPIAMELARRLEIANDKLDATPETQKGNNHES